MRRIPSVPKNIQNFGLSFIFIVILPLLPLFLELWCSSTISAKSLAIATAIYSVSIGVSSHDRLLFGFSIIISISFSVAFGHAVSTGNAPAYGSILAGMAILCISGAHLMERWNRHAIDSEEFGFFKSELH